MLHLRPELFHELKGTVHSKRRIREGYGQLLKYHFARKRFKNLGVTFCLSQDSVARAKCISQQYSEAISAPGGLGGSPPDSEAKRSVEVVTDRPRVEKVQLLVDLVEYVLNSTPLKEESGDHQS